MKNKLSFYDIKIEYINYLKIYDNKIPDIEYTTNNKFVCGVLFEIDDFCYFAPVSSFKEKQRTNFIIRDIDGKALSSIRFSFMLPIQKNLINDIVKVKDFSKETSQNKLFLNKELNHINKNCDAVINKAKDIYNKTINEQKLYKTICCNFKELENKTYQYDEIRQKKYDSLINALKNKYEDPKDFIKKQNEYTAKNGFEESFKNLNKKCIQLNVEIPKEIKQVDTYK